ncbi:MAG: family 16 glycosylhydrolase [Woeseiaceae bacterium]|nr:family 16 glycosylhydrolase [Woeseiaceae bacterium]
MHDDDYRPIEASGRVFRAPRFALPLFALPCVATGQVLWSDEFNSGSAPDPTVWSYDLGAGGWGNSELQEYTSDPANVRVEGGHLVITAQEQVLKGNRRKFTSARIRTENKLTFQYGTIEARIMVPDLANGLWPAFWTLGNNFGEVGWPDSGELDVMEMGSAAAIADGVVNRRVGSTAHWEHNNGYAGYGLTYDAASDLNGSFHNFRMEWTPDLISTYIDNNWIWSIDITPASCTDCTEFHQPHFIIFNLAVGGSFTGLYRANDITAPFPAEYRVDWVRISDNGYTILGGSAIGGGSGEFAHVDSITPSSTGGGPNKRAKATVVILDENGATVEGASVTATFTGSHNETVTAQTDASGTAELVTGARSRTVSFNVCVDDVVKPGMTYDEAANTETCDAF